jgi:hypothetical protein
VKFDKVKMREANDKQLDAIIAQATALRAGNVSSRMGAVSLLKNNVDTLVQWEKQLHEMHERGEA